MSSPALASTSMCLPAPHVSIIMLDVIWNRERLTGSWTRNTQECICEDFLTVLETYERYRVTMLRYSIHADIPCAYRNRVQPIKNFTSIVKLWSWFFFCFSHFIQFLLFLFFFLTSHILISISTVYRNLEIQFIRNTIIYNYDFILPTLYDSLASHTWWF